MRTSGRASSAGCEQNQGKSYLSSSRGTGENDESSFSCVVTSLVLDADCKLGHEVDDMQQRGHREKMERATGMSPTMLFSKPLGGTCPGSH